MPRRAGKENDEEQPEEAQVDEAGEQKDKPRPKMVQVRRVARSGGKVGASLVEYLDRDGGLDRRWVPSSEVQIDEDGAMRAAQDVLDMGASYGLPWAELFGSQIDVQQLQHELRKRGIWTLDDATHMDQVHRAVMTVVLPLINAAMVQAKAMTEGN